MSRFQERGSVVGEWVLTVAEAKAERNLAARRRMSPSCEARCVSVAMVGCGESPRLADVAQGMKRPCRPAESSAVCEQGGPERETSNQGPDPQLIHTTSAAKAATPSGQDAKRLDRQDCATCHCRVSFSFIAS